MKYSKEMVKDICERVEGGNSYEDSAKLAGISEATFYEWKKNKPEFLEELKKAELKCKSRNISLVQKAALTTWQAACWWLERKYKDEFGAKIITDVDAKIRTEEVSAEKRRKIEQYLGKPLPDRTGKRTSR